MYTLRRTGAGELEEEVADDVDLEDVVVRDDVVVGGFETLVEEVVLELEASFEHPSPSFEYPELHPSEMRKREPSVSELH